MRFAAFGCLKTFKQQIKNKLSQTGWNDTAGRVWIRAHRPQRRVIRTPPLYCGTATDHPDTALTQDAVRKLQKKKNRKFAEHGNKTVTVTWPNLLSQLSGHVTFWDQTNASVDLCHGAPLWEHTAWRGRYNSAFCSHHLPEDPPTLRHHHTLTSNLTFVAEAPPMTSQLRIKSESRATCKNTNWWLDCSRGLRGSRGRHVPPGSEYASVRFCHGPSPLWTDCCGRGFSRPFITSLPGRATFDGGGLVFLSEL